MPLKLLTWNIEQYGETRALDKEEMTTDVRNEYIVKLINSLNPDIVSIIEVKTTEPAIASEIAAMLCKSLWDNYKKKYSYVYTYHNWMEIYVYLYKYEVVTPVVLAKGEHVQYTRYGLEQLDFTKLVNPEKNPTKDTNKGLINHFPLIGYDTEYGRPLGLGLFYYPQEQKYLCFMAWHNLAGKQSKNKSSDAIPLNEMQLLANTDFIKEADKGITLKIDGKKINVQNILVSGDFNLDYENRDYWYDNFSKLTTRNKKKTYLHKYDPEKVFNSSDELRTVTFDNFLTRCAGFNNEEAAVIDIPKWIHNKKEIHTDLIKKTGLCDQSLMTEGVIYEALELFAEQTKDVFNFGIPKIEWPEIKKQLKDLAIHNNKVDTNSLDGVKKIYAKYKCSPYFKKLIEDIDKHIESLAEVYIYYKKIVDGNADIRYNDTLYLTLNILSDHLPVQLEIK